MRDWVGLYGEVDAHQLLPGKKKKRMHISFDLELYLAVI
jgi:hypothetical protein